MTSNLAFELDIQAILELIDQVSNAFDNNSFFQGVFIDLSKTFDTVDHNILLEKLSMYEVKGNNLKCFHRYLSKRKQYIGVFNLINIVLGHT